MCTYADGLVAAWEQPKDEFEDWACVFLEHARQCGHQYIVAMERFDISQRTINKTRDAHWPLDCIGAIKFIARQSDHIVEMQGAGDAKRFGTDYKLKEMGLWHKSDHARDATRHMLLNLAKHGVYEGPTS